MSEQFKGFNVKATLVALNYNFANTHDFYLELSSKNIIDKYKLVQKPQQIQVNGQIPNDPSYLQQLANIVPCEFVSDKTKIKLLYRGVEAKLVIDKEDFSDLDITNFASLSEDVLDLKISDIKAIGVNYSADYNLGNSKLQLLSSKVEEINDFSNNLTFEFVLPIEYKDLNLIATYRIKKVSGGDNTGKDRIYNVSVNYHYKFDDLSTQEKVSKLLEILEFTTYEEYLNKANGFLSINDK